MSSFQILMVASALCALFLVFALWASFGGRPMDDRQFLDPVPRPWRWLWPAIRVLEPGSNWVLRRLGPIRRHFDHALQAGGLERSITTSQLFAGACVLSLMVGTLLLLLHYSVMNSIDSAAVRAMSGGIFFSGLFTHAWVRRQVHARRRILARQLPVFADFIAMCVEAGRPVGAALNQAVERCPSGLLRSEFSQVLRDIKAGRRRPDALQAMADRLNHSAVSQFVLVLNAADREGIGIAPALKAQAEQYRTERFYQAESLAMQAPVKMLAPMVLFIFPGTFIVLMFPVLSRLISEGVFK